MGSHRDLGDLVHRCDPRRIMILALEARQAVSGTYLGGNASDGVGESGLGLLRALLVDGHPAGQAGAAFVEPQPTEDLGPVQAGPREAAGVRRQIETDRSSKQQQSMRYCT